MSYVKLNPKHAFKTVKVGDNWYVSLGGAIVMEADFKKRPTSFVRNANRMLRAIGTSNTVLIEQFLDSLREWMFQAAGNVNYARPNIRVE